MNIIHRRQRRPARICYKMSRCPSKPVYGSLVVTCVTSIFTRATARALAGVWGEGSSGSPSTLSTTCSSCEHDAHPDFQVGKDAVPPFSAAFTGQAWCLAKTRDLRAPQKPLARPQDIVHYIITVYDVLVKRQLLQAQCASGCKKWMVCSVALLISWTGRTVMLQWRLRAPLSMTMATMSLSILARRVGRGCRSRPLASFPERHGVFPSS